MWVFPWANVPAWAQHTALWWPLACKSLSSSSTYLFAVPALSSQGIVAPTVQAPDGNVEDPAMEKHRQGEGLGTMRL